MSSAYTTTTNKLKITELDFDKIKSALKTYLSGQTEFSGYDFEGSGLNILLDVLAYNTHYNAFYINMLASEMFIDSATLRSSIVSIAKQLGYTPSSRKGSTINLDLTITGSGSSVRIPKNTKFTTSIGSGVYTFLTTETLVADQDSLESGTYTLNGVVVREGLFTTSTFTAEGIENEKFTIPSADVDLDTLAVSLGGETYSKATDITQITANSKVYFVQEGRQEKYEVYFGDGVVGKAPETADQIQLQYNLSMLGSEGNGAKTFTFADSVTGVTAITATISSGFTRSIAGSERETAANIRANAPREFQMQKRIVTTDDYRARILNDYGSIEAVRVWDGAELDPPEYGRVYIAAKPTSGLKLSAAEKYRIKRELIKSRSMVTIDPIIVDPDYLTILLDCSVTYDPRQTTRTEDDVKAVVRNAIANYSSTTLNKFDEIYRNSVLTRTIDDSEISIKNSATSLTLMRSFAARFRSLANYMITFENPLHHPHDGHQSILTSDPFNIPGFTNVQLFDLDGQVFIRRGLGSESTGTSKFPRANVGTIDYANGVVDMQLNITGLPRSVNEIRLYARPDRKDLTGAKTVITTIDSTNSTIRMIKETDVIESQQVQGYAGGY